MIGGVMYQGKSRVTRDRTSSPPESTQNTYHALTALTLPVNTGRHEDLRSSIYRCFDYRRHRSLESDAQDDQMPPRDPEDVSLGI